MNGSEPIEAAEVGLFDRVGQSICIDCAKDATALLLCGAPIEEPIVGYGPFVMNRPEEIRQAIADYQSGKMGHLHKRTRCASTPVLPEALLERAVGGG